jgi:hypothetical protein
MTSSMTSSCSGDASCQRTNVHEQVPSRSVAEIRRHRVTTYDKTALKKAEKACIGNYVRSESSLQGWGCGWRQRRSLRLETVQLAIHS